MLAVAAPAVVLATGGVGALYRHTTNPPAAGGEGLAIAARAGAVLADLEFVQFHPTALDVEKDPLPLVSEAVRGEGAVLIDGRGRRFMTDCHPLAELAPRDVVARAIHRARKETGRVFLDASRAVGAVFADRFPRPFTACACKRESTPHANPSLLFRRPITIWGVLPLMIMAGRAFPACTRSGRLRAPGCTVPIAWRATA